MTECEQKAKKYLIRARTLDREIKSKKRELEKIRADVQCLNSPVLGDRVISSHTNNSNVAVDTAVDLERTIKSEIATLIDLQTEIHAKIERLPKAEHRIILVDYYVSCNRWDDVAENNGYSPRQMRRIHNAALRSFAEMYKI